MPRIDYINDPNAPQPNSVVPSVVAFIQNDKEEILLIHRSDNEMWALPGGGHEAGESISDTVVREVEEETGFMVRVARLIGIYTNPKHLMAYDDGEVRQQFSISFRAELVAGAARTSEESLRVEWVHPDRIPSLPMHPSMRLRISHGLLHDDIPFIG